MPRGRKKQETIAKADMKDALLNCRIYTQDQVRVAIAELCNREEIPAEAAKRIANVLDSVVSESFSKVMATSGL